MITYNKNVLANLSDKEFEKWFKARNVKDPKFTESKKLREFLMKDAKKEDQSKEVPIKEKLSK